MHSLLTPDVFAIVFEPFVGRRVGYVRPIGNVGDRLIELATVQLFATYGIDWQLVDLTPSPNLDPGLVRESSCPGWGWKGFSDEEATQSRADRGLASAG